MSFSKSLKIVAIVIVVIAVCFGIIGKFEPQLFLKVPNVGFILWAMSGHQIPPYLTSDAWASKENENWLRDGDVVVAAGAKSGTTWMLFCNHQIRVKGDDKTYPFEDVSLATPWPDLVQWPTGTWEEHRELLNSTVLPNGVPLQQYWDHPHYPHRVWKSHFTPLSTGGALPVKQRQNVRFLAMSRNGLDVVASMSPFFSSHSDDFRKLWGGFPPASSGNTDQDLSELFEKLLPGGEMGAFYWDYVKQWWPLRNEQNVLLLHYADAKKDLRGTVQKIADFVKVDLTSQQLDIVTNKCSIEYMRSKTQMFGYRLPLNAQFEPKTILNNGALIRKGGNGDGKAKLSEDEQLRWKIAEEDQLGNDPELLAWARNGRTNPSP